MRLNPMLLVGTAVLFLTPYVDAQRPPRVAPLDAPSVGEVAPAREPGERLAVSGVVYAADGRTPVPGASVYVYQTDARGFYKAGPQDVRDEPMGDRAPRLYALLRTDAQGRYSYRTIRPGSYPDSRVPQHIHYQVTAEGRGVRVFEIVFDDDGLVTAEIRRRAAQPDSIYALRKVERGHDRIGRVRQDVTLPD